MTTPEPGSVSTVFHIMEELIKRLEAEPNLRTVRVDFEAAAADDDPSEMIAFGVIQEAEHEIQVFSGGQERVAREETPSIEVECRVRGKATLRKCAARAFELASYVEDIVAAVPRLEGDVVGLQYLTVDGVTGEPSRTTDRARYIVTVSLTGRARLRA